MKELTDSEYFSPSPLIWRVSAIWKVIDYMYNHWHKGKEYGFKEPVSYDVRRSYIRNLTFKTAGSFSDETFTIPLYINCTTVFKSSKLTSLRITIGCWQGLTLNNDWKYSEHADNSIRWAWRCRPSAAKVTSTSVSELNSPENPDTRLTGWLFHRSEKYCIPPPSELILLASWSRDAKDAALLLWAPEDMPMVSASPVKKVGCRFYLYLWYVK